MTPPPSMDQLDDYMFNGPWPSADRGRVIPPYLMKWKNSERKILLTNTPFCGMRSWRVPAALERMVGAESVMMRAKSAIHPHPNL